VHVEFRGAEIGRCAEVGLTRRDRILLGINSFGPAIDVDGESIELCVLTLEVARLNLAAHAEYFGNIRSLEISQAQLANELKMKGQIWTEAKY
jgi:hypothetical protein